MLNKDIFHSNPKEIFWKNQGVAKVDGHKFTQNLDELKFEVQHFVCEGQYKKGLEKILRNYLDHLGQDEQKTAWVSGFFGSGKSHLCKMLRALWENTELPGGITARGAANLPEEILILLKDLDTEAKRHGGLVAVSGTLSAGNTAFIRRTLAELVFDSRGLPADIPKGRFILWLRQEGIEDKVRVALESKGKIWDRELNNFRLSITLHQCLSEVQPALGDPATVRDLLKAQYPGVGNEDITNEELKNILIEVLAPNGKLPLTLIILDEMQQYIGADGDRSMAVQELTQLLVSSFGGKLLLVATGQNALSGTANLRKLMDRYTVSVDLQDADVDTVVRKTVLLKKPGIKELKQLLDNREGEISRHLHGQSAYQFKQSDSEYMAADYPLLATRRRLWESIQRAMDGAGTNSQLRGQLRLVYESLQDYADKPLGQVVRGDYIFDRNNTGMLQASILTNELNNEIQVLLAKDNPEEQLQGRILSMVFLLNRLNHLNQDDKKVSATEGTLTDLLLEDLYNRPALESKMTAALEALVKKGLLQRIDGAYLIQTKEGNAWHQTFEQEKNALANNPGSRDSKRLEFLKSTFKTELAGLVNIFMGATAQPHPVEIAWGPTPTASAKGISVWVQEGGSTTEDQVLKLAQSNRDGHIVYVFIPRESSGDLSTQIVEIASAEQTLQLKVSSHGAEAEMARQAMQDIKKNAESKARAILADMILMTKVWISGGILMDGITLRGKIEDACSKMLARKYPDFAKGDQNGWPDVLLQCKQGSSDNLERLLSYNGNLAEHPAVRQVQNHIGASAKWADITLYFEAAPYGWSVDTTEGILYLLWALNLIEVHLAGQNAPSIGSTDRRELRKSTVTTNLIQITPEDKMKWRGIMNALDPKGPTIQGKELESENEGFKALYTQYQSSGGSAPAPTPEPCGLVEEAHAMGQGNQRFKFLADHAPEFKELIKVWIERRDSLASRQKTWEKLNDLLTLGTDVAELQGVKQEAEALCNSRGLLSQPDPVLPLLRKAAEVARRRIMEAWHVWRTNYEVEREQMQHDPDWAHADANAQAAMMARVGLRELGNPDLATDDKVLASLQAQTLSTWQDQTDALGGRFAKLRHELMQARQPKTQAMKVPRGVINNQAELEDYIKELRRQVEPALAQGPVILE